MTEQIRGARGYTAYQIGLDWLTAALVFAQLIFGESMTEARDMGDCQCTERYSHR